MPAPISILPLGDRDFSTIAALEAHVFNDDPISVYAFDPARNSPAALHERAVSLAAPPNGCSVRMRNAVTEENQIVGFALWKFYENDDEPLDAKDGLQKTGTRNGVEKENEKAEEESNENK
jgi:hypothetical protein